MRQKRSEQTRSVTFQKAAENYIEANRAGGKNAKHRQQWENTLKTYVP